jgi:hypothetical protein
MGFMDKAKKLAEQAQENSAGRSSGTGRARDARRASGRHLHA